MANEKLYRVVSAHDHVVEATGLVDGHPAQVRWPSFTTELEPIDPGSGTLKLSFRGDEIADAKARYVLDTVLVLEPLALATPEQIKGTRFEPKPAPKEGA